MAKKTLGYEELQWTCPNCSGINPGPEKACGSCGAPQPDDVRFQKAARAELLQDEQVAERAKAGADIHCPYCGARNRGDAQNCSQCGGDLVSGERRESGQVLGAFQTGPAAPVTQVACPNCGSDNPDTANTCAQCGAGMHSEPPLAAGSATSPIPSNVQTPAPTQKRRFPIGLVIILVLICVVAAVFMLLSLRTEALSGTVADVAWERTVGIEALVPVEDQDWQDRVPTGAELLGCKSEVRSIKSEPVAGAEEVCGTPYSVDTGSGYAEVVQDCEYHVYDQYCTFTVEQWTEVDQVTLSGHDLSPQWPEPTLITGQRLGQGYESYTIWFDTPDGDYSYGLDEFNRFQQFQIGSTWTLNVNSFGNVVSVEP